MPQQMSNSGPGLGPSGSISASSLLVAQMLTGTGVNAATGVTAPFGLIFSGEAMEGIEQAGSGRSSTSGAVTIGDREAIMGYASDLEMEGSGGNVASSNVPNVPGYGDLRIIYNIVCFPWDRSTGARGVVREFHQFIHIGQADQSW